MKRALVGLALLSACGNAPSADDCARLLAHVVELELAAAGASATTPEAKAELEAQRKKVTDQIGKDFLATCEKDLPRSQVECGLKAASLEDLGKCDT